MTSLNQFSEEIMLSILDYLNYEDIFYKEKTMLSKSINGTVRTLLKITKIKSEVSQNLLLQYWDKKELGDVPMILYRPNKYGSSLRNRLFSSFEDREPHQKLFISNIFTNKLSFMIRPLEDEILFIDFFGNNLSYNVYTRPRAKLKYKYQCL